MDKLVNCTNFAREIQEVWTGIKLEALDACEEGTIGRTVQETQDEDPVLLQKLPYSRVFIMRVILTRRTYSLLTQHKGHDFDKLTTILARFE